MKASNSAIRKSCSIVWIGLSAATASVAGQVVAPSAPATSRGTDATASRPAATQSQPGEAPALTLEPPRESAKGAESARKYRTSLAVSAKREPEPPSYVRPVSELGLPATEGLNWLLMGIEHRSRFEIRDDDYRNALTRDSLFVMRSRAFVGIRDVLDPFRFGVEFQDSREFGSQFPNSTRNVNEYDFLQAYAELFFKDAFGKDEPLRLMAGRMAIDYVDRRLRTRNGFRNTTNAFDGFRIVAGQQKADWEIDAFAVQPVVIDTEHLDRPDEERWLYGVAGAWRRWSDVITLEPYYFVLDEDFKGWNAADVEIHTWGLHVFGPIGESGFDYDLDAAFQYGRNRGQLHRAMAFHAELGHTFKIDWEPRLAGWINYATGDRAPGDGVSERFDSLFGSSTGFYGFNEFSTWQNVISPSTELRVHPMKKMIVSLFYRTYWLASDQDAWVRGGRIDRTGRSGEFVGQEIDLIVRYDVDKHISLEGGIGHFMPGNFVRNTGDSPDADMFYLQTVIRL